MNDNVLITIANDLDQNGKHDLANAVDSIIKSAAGRPRAPHRDLDEDVKKDLMKFLSTVQYNMSTSVDTLGELFRRLRYFGIDDVIKQLGLDKVIKDMSRVDQLMSNAVRSMYTLTNGRKPSNKDMEQMAEDFGLTGGGTPSPLDFFNSQNPSEVDLSDSEEEEGDDVQPMGQEAKEQESIMSYEDELTEESPDEYGAVGDEEMYDFWSEEDYDDSDSEIETDDDDEDEDEG